MIMLAMRLFAFSKNERNNNAGPMVIHIYNKEGGYLVVLIKEIKVYMKLFYTPQGIGFP